ncbi:MAG TPA: hypothetical protein VIH76_09745 [Candidatus Acidoferrales bacterium]
MSTDPKDSNQKLDELRAALSKQVLVLRGDLQTAEVNLAAVVTTINLLKGGKIDSPTEADSYIREFRGLTQVNALIKLARDSGTNRFRITDAKRVLVAAGLINSKKNASNILYTTIQRSEKFKRVAPGEYELILKPVIATAGISTESLKRVESIR